ncbi:protein EVI2B [Centrocercus urophasianus]|uniref:protein EVI2B n=1 Tax=Centrocercus urophasianus TaxID=9002 RepID=UPI001C64F066|nr:protein EVI2B [Centrocercus urophasianus]
MVSNTVILLLFCGEIWKSLSTEIPSNVSTSESIVHTSTSSTAEDRSTTNQLQTTGPSMQKPAGALTAATTLPQLPEPYIEPTNGSWVAAMIMGIVLVGMVIAISMIVIWKRCKKPLLADSNWAGQSPFADGDTPDTFVDSGQATKRLSVLFMLPWKLREEASVQHDPPASEKPPNGTASNTCRQQPAAEHSCSATDPAAAAAPGPEAASPEQVLHPQPAEGLELPPPPAWLTELTEPAEQHAADPGQQEELHSEVKEPYPPPLQLITEEICEPPPPPEQPQ